MGEIVLNEIVTNQNRVEYRYTVSEDLEQFFLSTPYFIEYWIDGTPLKLDAVPKSILAVPFCCNLLPICWITDSSLHVSEVDKDLAESIELVKSGFEKMYSNVKFGGHLYVDRVISNRPITCGKNAAFFSGGVDSWCTVLRHLSEKPDLIAIWGADIPYDDEAAWGTLLHMLNQSSEQLDLPLLTIKSSFRKVIYEDCLTWTFESELGDNWWHGIQHGIGIASHAAPCNYLRGCTTQYLAASVCEEDGFVKIGSYPTTDGVLRFGQCNVKHDAFINRQFKIEEIKNYCETNRKKIQLHVCWEHGDGNNCCNCEKCYRTIAGLLAANCNPENYGFEGRRTNYALMKSMFINNYQFRPGIERKWKPIAERLDAEYCLQRNGTHKIEWLKGVFRDKEDKEEQMEALLKNTDNREISPNHKWGKPIFWVCIWTLLFVFFSRIHPIILWDADDWLYASYTRLPFPLLAEWNPTRVLPEVLMSFCGLIAAKGIYPFTGNYIGSMTMAFSGIVSLFIIFYAIMAMNLIEQYCELKMVTYCCLTSCFLLLHFLIYRISNSNNYYLFYSNDATCYFFYLIPLLLNCGTVLWFERKQKTSFIDCTLAYFCVFSNLFSAYVLVSYSFTKLMMKWFSGRNKRIKKEWFAQNYLWISVIIMFLISLVFEMTGGRAKSLNTKGFSSNLTVALSSFLHRNINVNVLFVLFLIESVIFYVVLKGHYHGCYCKTVGKKVFTVVLGIEVLSVAYVILLSAATIPEYAGRPDVVLGIWMYPILLCVLFAGGFVKKHRVGLSVFVLELFIILFSINTSERTFRESAMGNVDPAVCNQITEDIIQQVKGAVEAGQTIVKIHVPLFTDDDNWPLALYANNRITDTLYKHGIITTHIDSDLVTDKNMNQKYNMKLSDK